MKRVVIFANGEAGDIKRQSNEIEPNDLILCADGGAVHAIHAGVIPHLVIGDLDSLQMHQEIMDRLHSHNVAFVEYPVEKDLTDLELAFDYAQTHGATEIVVFCAFGARLDHLLGNVFLACLPKYASMRIRLSDGCQESRLLRGPGREIVSGKIGETLSLIPLTASVQGVHLHGAKWPLENAALHFGSSLSLSNSFAESSVEISVNEGLLLLIKPVS